MKIICAIDIIDGSCVRLVKGSYATKKVYSEDPVAMAKSFEEHGLKHLHLVDLDGAKAKKVVNLSVLKAIRTETNLTIDVGGGLQSEDDFEAVFDSGADMATIGSLAAKNRELTLKLLEKWGPDKLILGADCLNEKIAISGWQEQIDFNVYQFVESYLKAGFKKVISTDVSKDGLLSGPAFDLYENLLNLAQQNNLPLELIASGGVTTVKDLNRLKNLQLDGSIIGKALYENYFSLEELARWEKENG
jgi:phosphoribosylformimino-5-aminoimidazole carboxamide ribotide isomerase